MKVKLGQAVKMFFSSASLEMVFFEAISNSLDAEATEIILEISIAAQNRPETLEIKIIDNGHGFDDVRFRKFSNLFDVEEKSHKGLGRLVYLVYFNEININSTFGNTNHREFLFSEEFDENKFLLQKVPNTDNGTKIHLRNYTLQKVAKIEYLRPKELKVSILKEFYARLYQLKKEGNNVSIIIRSKIGESYFEEILTTKDIPQLHVTSVETSINLYDKFELHYSIEECPPNETNLTSAISVDNRTFNVNLIASENIPTGYDMVFLLFSDFFTGKVDASRQNLAIKNNDFKEIENVFRKKIADLIEENIPKVKKNNQQIKQNLTDKYPHLTGYFDEKNIGYLKKSEILRNAQEEFFQAQKELLEANHLTTEQFNKSLEISARALTEYILFRQLTIKKLKDSSVDTSEADLHKLFAAKGKDGVFEKSNIINDLYRNNSWLLDDKYMTYEVVLSDREMNDLLRHVVKDEEIENDIDRPDLAFIFSNNPNEEKPFDVVIVELKKRGVNHYEKMKTINQLETRARNLMKYYNNKIQRIWYYGIVEFDDELELALAGRFNQLYSTGKMYYSATEVAVSLNPIIKIPTNIYMWDIDAVVNDADIRNSTFLNFIKSKFVTQ